MTPLEEFVEHLRRLMQEALSLPGGYGASLPLPIALSGPQTEEEIRKQLAPWSVKFQRLNGDVNVDVFDRARRQR